MRMRVHSKEGEHVRPAAELAGCTAMDRLDDAGMPFEVASGWNLRTCSLNDPVTHINPESP
jgi:hypothetical protein